jgi:hypothetical protein
MVRSAIAAALVLTVTGAAPKPVEPPIEATLTSLREVRTHELMPSDGFVFDHNKPGLTLAFTLTPPSGLTLLELRQPQQMVATDSTGADLTGIEPDFMDRREFVELEQSFNKAPTGFTLRLTPAAREAEWVTVSGMFDAVFYAGTTTEEIEITREWSELPSSLTGGETIRVRLAGEGQQAELEMQPGSVHARFEEITLLAGADELDSMGTMWNDEQATLMFGGSPDGVTSARFVARTGLRTKTIGVRIVEQPLP